MILPTLLYICILSMLSIVDGIPVPPHNFKNIVKAQADTIIVRINEHNKKINLSSKIQFGEPGLYPEIPVDKPIQGIASIVETLSDFQKVVQTLPKGYTDQLRIDLSTLLGYLKNRMESMHCTPKEPNNEKSHDVFIMDNSTYHVTVGRIAYDRLKQFMEKLILNLNQLKSC